MRHNTLRYIEFCINTLESDDASLHNLAVSLYSVQVSRDMTYMQRSDFCPARLRHHGAKGVILQY
jgi:hypothetical protein